MYDSENQRPIAIFSSFRSGSTWLWLRARELQGVCAYKEVFHERLNITNEDDIREFTTDSWPSRHSAPVRYFEEFLPLLKPGTGVLGYDIRMAYDWAMPKIGNVRKLRKRETDYLDRLCLAAWQTERRPVLTFNRGIARSPEIKLATSATSLLLTRSLALQWASYLNLRTLGVDYFLRTAFRSIQTILSDPEWSTSMRLFLPIHMSNSKPDLEDLTIEDAWIAFVGLHLITYAIAYPSIDLHISIERLSSSNEYYMTTAQRLFDETGLKFDLSGAQIVNAAGSEIVLLVESSYSRLKERLEQLVARHRLDDRTANFLHGVLRDLQIFGQCGVAKPDTSLHLMDIADRGRDAWEKRRGARPLSRRSFESELDSVEDSLFPPAFSFWTRSAVTMP